jgi:hypothetical protein
MNYSTEISILKAADVVVVGGGPAGVCAAIASARMGASTLLVEQYGCLGGMMTLGLVMPLDARCSRSGKPFGGILEEIVGDVIRTSKEYCGGVGKDHHIYSSPHVIKYVLLDTVLNSNAEVLFHTSLADVCMGNNKISQLIVQTKSGLKGISGRVFIDATGDGDLLARTEEPFVSGSEPGVMEALDTTGLNKIHEETTQYGGYAAQGVMQPVSIMFTMGGVDTVKAKPLINKRLSYADIGITKEEFQKLPYANTPGFTENGDELPLPQGRVLFFKNRRPGEVTINMTRVTGINGADALDLTKGEVIAQRQTFYVIDFLKRFIPGFENAYLLETANVLGVRETRRLVGRYVLTGTDAITCVQFPDVIAHGSYIIDIHDPQGRKKAIGGKIQGDCYDIPYRCLLPKTVENFLVAGRCISTDHVAHSTTRIQGTCMLTGQAAGVAAALAVKSKCAPGNVKVEDLQEALISAGVDLRRQKQATQTKHLELSKSNKEEVLLPEIGRSGAGREF